jgi:glycosyltransferase involved in cell wall biosynthesis
MKIVHYLSEVRLAHGGVVRAVLDFCAAFAKAGHDTHLLTFDPADVPQAWRQGGPLLPRATVLDWPERPKPIRRFRKADLLRAEGVIAGARVLHLHVPWESTNLQLAEIARSRGVPYILSIHGMLDDWTIAQGRATFKRLYLRFRASRLLTHAAAVHCTAEAERDQASKWFTNPNTVVLPLLFDLEPFRAPPRDDAGRSVLERIPGEGPVVLFLSRLHPKKGLEHLLHAAKILWHQGLVFRVAVAGGEDAHAPDYAARLRELASTLGIADRVTFLGLVVGGEKTALLRAARVNVLPTSQENWGFVPLESLALGRPVITTRGVDIWPELSRSGGAVIVDQTPRAIADAMRPFLESESLADATGAKGREWILRDHDPRAVLTRYEDLYRTL